jgi:hypothetical protein
MTIKKTGGNWSPRDWPTYFVASSIELGMQTMDVVTHILLAVNELRDRDMEGLDVLIENKNTILIDSGVFWLATRHALANDLTMDQALQLAPGEVDNFQWLFDKYVGLIEKIGDKVWGYIEIDQGGRENKIKTRAKLEAMGLRPIPVYHPFNDGWDYFDHLAENYDRICFGNVVQADQSTRKRLMATAWERRQKYPHLWIHMLGLTPQERSAAYPIPSCDSSTWLAGVRWGTHNAFVANKRCWSTGTGLLYVIGAEASSPTGHIKARRLAGYESEMMVRTLKAMFEDQRAALGHSEEFWKGAA